MNTFTNINDIDPIVADVMALDRYVKVGDISVTGLIAPTQATYLMREHRDELTFDISERVYAWIGNVLHAEIAKVPLPEGSIKEQRFITEVEGWEVSGQIDRWMNGWLVDYKTTSVFQYQIATKGGKSDWEKQLNLYAALLRRHDYKVEHCEVIAILRDHSAGRTEQEGYPASGVQRVELRCWPPEEAEAYLVERVLAHQAAATGDYELCTAEERWASPDKWVVKKRGGVRAMKGGVFDSVVGAIEFAEGAGKPIEIEHRPGVSARCQPIWCKAAPFCDQAKAMGDDSQKGGQD